MKEMKINKYVIMAGAALLALGACNKQEVAGVSEMDGQIKFLLDGDFSATVETRADPSIVYGASGNKSKPDNIYVAAAYGSSPSTNSPGFTSTQFSVSGTNPYTGGKYWAAQSSNSYTFYASTKAVTYSSGSASITPSATIADDLYGTATASYSGTSYPTNGAVSMTMHHIYARIGFCNVSAPANYTISNLSVTVVPKLPTANARFTFSTSNSGVGSWSTTASHYSDGSAVTLCTATGITTDQHVWLVPGTYTLTFSYTISRDGYSETFSGSTAKTASVSIQQGVVNNITATLPSGNDSEININVTVDDWTSTTKPVTWNN